MYKFGFYPVTTTATVGEDGSAESLDQITNVNGKLYAVSINNTDEETLTLTLTHTVGEVAVTLLSLVDFGDAEALLFPRTLEHDDEGTELTVYAAFPINGTVSVAVTGANADVSIDVALVIEMM